LLGLSFIQLKAQDIYRFRAIERASSSKPLIGPQKYDWKPNNHVLVINYEKKEVDIYTPEVESFAWVEIREIPIDGEDSIRVKYQSKYITVDKNGERCAIFLTLMSPKITEYDALLIFIYDSKSFCYKTKIVQ
jgi:hypothetical protein